MGGTVYEPLAGVKVLSFEIAFDCRRALAPWRSSERKSFGCRPRRAMWVTTSASSTARGFFESADLDGAEVKVPGLPFNW